MRHVLFVLIVVVSTSRVLSGQGDAASTRSLPLSDDTHRQLKGFKDTYVVEIKVLEGSELADRADQDLAHNIPSRAKSGNYVGRRTARPLPADSPSQKPGAASQDDRVRSNPAAKQET
jgi:hypothetical protein